MSLKIEEYREGGRNGEVLVFPTRTECGEHHAAQRRRHADAALGLELQLRGRQGQAARRASSSLLNDLHVPSNIWYFRRGLPLKYTGPTMHAQENKVAIDTMVIAHEGIYQVRSSASARR
jgi:phage tail-like protein